MEYENCLEYCDSTLDQCFGECLPDDVQCLEECKQCDRDCEDCVKECEGDRECEYDCYNPSTCDCDVDLDICIKECEGNELCIRECNLCNEQCAIPEITMDRKAVNGKVAGSASSMNIAVGVVAGCMMALVGVAAYINKKRSDRLKFPDYNSDE